MATSWLDMNNISFNTLLLLERVQLSWFPGWVNEDDLCLALRANPVVEWYLRHKCPGIASWLDGVMERDVDLSSEPPRQAELRLLRSIDDLITYVHDPAVYDSQEFLGWDSSELTSLVDFLGKTVIDVGAGTGRLAFTAAPLAACVFAVEPVGNLRLYMQEKAARQGITNLYPVDGLITRMPFPDGFADITMGGHVFGGDPQAEYAELARVTRPGGSIILCPGSSERETAAHEFLLAHGFSWSVFIEPPSSRLRKYWKTL